jgi:hypothetical protein
VADQPSFIITHLIDGLRDVLPEPEQAKLGPYQARAATAGADETAEWHRAYRCARWAADVVSTPAHTGLAGELRRVLEVVKQVEETVGGQISNFFELPYRQALSPKMEAELTWIYEAVHVAEKVAGKVGWDAVGWQGLLDEVLAIPPQGQAPPS